MYTKTTLAAASAALIALAACTDEQLANSDPNAGTGALVGAAAGALIGRTIADDGSRTEGALLGAALGAGAGALIGQDLARQKAELEQEFDSDQIDVINTGEELVVRMPQDILFAFDSADVNAGLRSDLLVLADSLNRYPDSTVSVVGHTDNVGGAAYNQGLSERRANSVASILRSGGVSSSRIRASGAGENQPIASNLTPEGQAQNRRVDITITPNAV